MSRRRKPKPTPVDDLIAEVGRTDNLDALDWLERRIQIDVLSVWAAQARGRAEHLDYDWIASESDRIAKAIKQRRAELKPKRRRWRKPEWLDLIATPREQWNKSRISRAFNDWSEVGRRHAREEIVRYLDKAKILDPVTIARFLEVSALPYDGANPGLWQRSLCEYERKGLAFLVVELVAAWPVSE